MNNLFNFEDESFEFLPEYEDEYQNEYENEYEDESEDEYSRGRLNSVGSRIYNRPANMYRRSANIYKRPANIYKRPANIYRRPANFYGRSSQSRFAPQPGFRRRKYPRPPGSFSLPYYGVNQIQPDCSEYVRLVQSLLNRALSLNLPVDGIMSTETRSAIRSFQSQSSLPVNSNIVPPSEPAPAGIGANQADQPSQPPVGEPATPGEYGAYEFFNNEDEYFNNEDEYLNEGEYLNEDEYSNEDEYFEY